MIVYMARNKINGKLYIGQTRNGLKRRRIQHLSDARRDVRYPLYNAIRLYGDKNFTWEILYTATSIKDLNEAEEFYIQRFDTMKKGYNVTRGGETPMLGIKRSAATRQKISEAKKGKHIGVNNPNFGKPHSIETRKKLSEAHKGKTLSDETKKKISDAQKGEKHYLFGKKMSVELRIKLSEAHKGKYTGEKHPYFDQRIHAFYHPQYRLAFCTQFVLREEFLLSKSHLSSVIVGREKSTGGWRMASPEYIQELRERKEI